MAVPYSKPKLIYEGFVDGFIRVGKRDYIPISSIIMVVQNRGKLAANLKRMYVAKGKYVNLAREERIQCFIIVGLKGDSFCVSCPLEPTKFASYLTQWRLGRDIADEDPWNGLREGYSNSDLAARSYRNLCQRKTEAKGITGENVGATSMVSGDTNDSQSREDSDRGPTVCTEPKNV